MSIAFNYYHEPVFPWSSTDNDDSFKKIVKRVLITFIIFGLVVPWLPSPEAEKKPLKQISPRLAKLITKKRLQKPKIAKVKSVKKKVAKKKTQKKIAKAKKKVVKKKQVKARKKAQQTGLMAMRSDIQDLQSMFDLSSLNNKKPLQNNHSKAKHTKSSSALSNRAIKSSGGIDTSKLSRSTGNTGLSDRKGTKVSSNLGTGATNIPRRTSSGQNARAIEELNYIFDKYKGSLQNIYQRALRKNPSLQGKVIFELTINAAGKVTKCKIISSELNSKALERRLISKVKSFRFSSKNVSTVTVTMPIDFLPS